jgi:hypothetical protein
MNKSKIPILIYTHSDVEYMWVALLGQMNKYVNGFDVHFAYNDTFKGINNHPIPKDWKLHTYTDNTIWTDRVNSILKEIDSKYVLFLHEDWLPTGDVVPKIVDNMVEWMDKNRIDFLLSYSHWTRVEHQQGEETGYPLYKFYKEDNHIFQPAIWLKSTFEEFTSVLKKAKNQNEDADTLRFMNTRKCYSVQNSTTVRSLRTTNSLFFPHMHALSEGKWNFTKYPTLKKLLDDYGIETNSRGIHSWWELDTQ